MNNNDIYFFFQSIKSKLTPDECFMLDDVYTYITDYEETAQQFEEESEIFSNYIETTFENLKKANDDPNKDMRKEVTKILDNENYNPLDAFEILYDIQETNTFNKQKQEILTMVKRGFVFNSGIGKHIYTKYINEQNEILREKKLKSHETAFQKKLDEELKKLKLESKVKWINSNTIEIWKYNAIDVTVNINTYEMKGKGTRKYKDDIITITKTFVNLFNEYEDLKTAI